MDSIKNNKFLLNWFFLQLVEEETCAADRREDRVPEPDDKHQERESPGREDEKRMENGHEFASAWLDEELGKVVLARVLHQKEQSCYRWIHGYQENERWQEIQRRA